MSKATSICIIKPFHYTRNTANLPFQARAPKIAEVFFEASGYEPLTQRVNLACKEAFTWVCQCLRKTRKNLFAPEDLADKVSATYVDQVIQLQVVFVVALAA